MYLILNKRNTKDKMPAKGGKIRLTIETIAIITRILGMRIIAAPMLINTIQIMGAGIGTTDSKPVIILANLCSFVMVCLFTQLFVIWRLDGTLCSIASLLLSCYSS